MISPLSRLTRYRWFHHPAGRIVALLALAVLIGVQAELAHHAALHSSCAAGPASSPTNCAICAAAANFTATVTLGLLPGNAAFCGFLVLLALLRISPAPAVPRTARGPPPAAV